MEQFNRVNQVILKYYTEAIIEPTVEDFELWIECLKEPMKSGFRIKGFEESKTALPFKRFYLEYYDDGLREYLEANLSKEDFKYYVDLSKEQ